MKEIIFKSLTGNFNNFNYQINVIAIFTVFLVVFEIIFVVNAQTNGTTAVSLDHPQSCFLIFYVFKVGAQDSNSLQTTNASPTPTKRDRPTQPPNPPVPGPPSYQGTTYSGATAEDKPTDMTLVMIILTVVFIILLIVMIGIMIAFYCPTCTC